MRGLLRALAARFRSAACDGDREGEESFQLGANVNATDGLGYSAQLVELLIAKGATVNLRSGNGSTALMCAARNGDTQAVNALLRRREINQV